MVVYVILKLGFAIEYNSIIEGLAVVSTVLVNVTVEETPATIDEVETLRSTVGVAVDLCWIVNVFAVPTGGVIVRI